MAVIPTVKSVEFRFFGGDDPVYGVDPWIGSVVIQVDEMKFANLTLMSSKLGSAWWAPMHAELRAMGVKMAWWTHISNGERRLKRFIINENCTDADLAFIRGLMALDKEYVAAGGFSPKPKRDRQSHASD